MARRDLGTGVLINEVCAIDDYILCTVEVGAECFPWVGKCTMSLRVLMWVGYSIYAVWVFRKLVSIPRTAPVNILWTVMTLAIACGFMRLIRDLTIIAVPYQSRSFVGTFFDLLWYLLPDVVVILTLCGLYTLQFFTMTANHAMRDKGVYVLYASHAGAIALVVGGGVALGLGQAIVFPLIISVMAIVVVGVLFFLYYGNKVRKQLLTASSTSSQRAAEDVSQFLRRHMQLLGVAWLIYVVSSATNLVLSHLIVSHSGAFCSVMQLVHRVVEFLLLGFWIYHVNFMVDKLGARASRLGLDSKTDARNSEHKKQSRVSRTSKNDPGPTRDAASSREMSQNNVPTILTLP